MNSVLALRRCVNLETTRIFITWTLRISPPLLLGARKLSPFRVREGSHLPFLSFQHVGCISQQLQDASCFAQSCVHLRPAGSLLYIDCRMLSNIPGLYLLDPIALSLPAHPHTVTIKIRFQTLPNIL